MTLMRISSQQDMRAELVIFDDLELVIMNTTGHVLQKPRDILQDRQAPENYFVADENIVFYLHSNGLAEIFAGDSNAPVHMDRENVVFTKIAGIHQREDNSLIICDQNCVIKINATTKETSTFAGNCLQKGSFNEEVTSSDAKFSFISACRFLEERKVYYYMESDTYSVKIIKHDLGSDSLTIAFKTFDIKGATTFVVDSLNENFFIRHTDGITQVNIATLYYKTQNRASFSTNQDQFAYTRPMEARHGLDWAITDQVLIYTGSNAYSLEMMNIIDNSSRMICKYIFGEAYNLGDQTSCRIYNPLSVVSMNGTIFVGVAQNLGDKVKGDFLRLNYSSPSCTPPPRIENGYYSHEKSRYNHLESVKVECNHGYTSSQVLTCVQGQSRNRSAVGVWDIIEPQCISMDALSIKPSQGPYKGGTHITINGVTSLIVSKIVVQSGSRELERVFELKDSYSFRMIPRDDNNNRSNIRVYFHGGNNYQDLKFSYLPDPVARFISRKRIFISGGLRIDFTVFYVYSASIYELKLYEAAVNQSLVVNNCERSPSKVSCFSPELSQFTKVSNTLEAPKEIHAELYADNFFVQDSSFEMEITPDPMINPFNDTMVLYHEINRTLTIYGEHLNNGAVKTDYEVMMIPTETATTYVCHISRLTSSQLSCEVKGLPSQSFQGIVVVSVGRLNFTAGQILYKAHLMELAPASKTYIVIIVSTVVPILLIVTVTAVLLVRCKLKAKKIKRRDTGVTYYKVDGLKPLEFQVELEKKYDLQKFYLNSGNLTYDPNPIGKGNFGYIYVGKYHFPSEKNYQTVAVKTLKDHHHEMAAAKRNELVEDFIKEACFLRDFSHQNILTAIGLVWERYLNPLVVLPYMNNGDLCSLLRKEEIMFTVGDLLHFCAQVACGMTYLSENKLIHRDLAARNCLVDENYIVKVADFGMSRDVYEVNYYRETSQERPKPVRWMSIESIREGRFDSLTDVWSFGVLMWEVFTRGGLPYPDINNKDILAYLMDSKRLCKPKYADLYVFDLMSSCWLEERTERPSFKVLHEKLDEILNCEADLYARDFTRDIKDSYSKGDISPRYLNAGAEKEGYVIYPMAETDL